MENRKIARKWLILKLDDYINGPLSKRNLKGAEERRKKKKKAQKSKKKYGLDSSNDSEVNP
jgi:hypothetical protein